MFKETVIYGVDIWQTIGFDASNFIAEISIFAQQEALNSNRGNYIVEMT
jgi:hypothetical protein